MLKWEETKMCYLLYTERVMSCVIEKVKEWKVVMSKTVGGTRKWKMNTCIEEDTRGGFFCIVLLFCFIIIVMAHSVCKFGFVNFIV
jgi:hypothetical protein